jgi:hypothetical protein
MTNIVEKYILNTNGLECNLISKLATTQDGITTITYTLEKPYRGYYIKNGKKSTGRPVGALSNPDRIKKPPPVKGAKGRPLGSKQKTAHELANEDAKLIKKVDDYEFKDNTV